MNLPKIIFRHSWLYDGTLVRDPKWKKPKDEVIYGWMHKLEDEWRTKETDILKEISLVTKLLWHEKEVVCYFTYGIAPYSDPLTLNGVSDTHTLTHELIHRILSEPENWPHIKDNYKKLMEKYKDETESCRVHVIVHALHMHILKKLFNEETLEKEMKVLENSPDYKKSWEIVKRDGYENIIAELTKGL